MGEQYMLMINFTDEQNMNHYLDFHTQYFL